MCLSISFQLCPRLAALAKHLPQMPSLPAIHPASHHFHNHAYLPTSRHGAQLRSSSPPLSVDPLGLPLCLTFSHSLPNSHAWQALPHLPDAVQGPLDSPHEHSQLKLHLRPGLPPIKCFSFATHGSLVLYSVTSTRLQTP